MTTENSKESPAIGIDLGTTYSAVAVLRHGKVEIIANEVGYFTTPSYVAFTSVEHLIGNAARDQAVTNPSNTVYDAKRLIGRKFDDPIVQQDIKKWPFKVIDDDSKPKVQIEYKGETKTFYAEEITAMVLGKMKETAESYLNQTVKDAVITVPAYFNNSQRQATRDAARIAGLNVLSILNEPTAAAIAYKFQNNAVKYEASKNILVYDLGGGTFDVSIMTAKDRHCKVIATTGDTHLGGEDFDDRVVEHLKMEFERKFKKASNNPRINCCLRYAAERAKRYLSSAIKAAIGLGVLSEEEQDFSVEITRPLFEDSNADLFKATLKPVEQALTDAKLRKDEIDEIILVGGSTRIVKIQKLLFDFFDGKKELNKTINPDEAVAYGAAVHAAVLHGDYSAKISGLPLQEVTPLSLGIGTRQGFKYMKVFIERNSSIPIKIVKRFIARQDNQTAIKFPVYQSESTCAAENHLLGNLILSNIPAAPVGAEGVIISFEIDSDGILTVTAALEKDPSNSSSIKIENTSTNFTSEEIDAMIRSQQDLKEQARNRREIGQMKVILENTLYEIKNALNSESASLNVRQAVKREYEETIDWLASDDGKSITEYRDRFRTLKKKVARLFDKD